MTQEKQALVERFGMDYKGALARFLGNEELYFTFLAEMATDESLQAIQAAKKSGDLEALTGAVHALKSTSGTLGFTRLFDACVVVMDALRSDDPSTAQPFWEPLEDEFAQATALCKQLTQ